MTDEKLEVKLHKKNKFGNDLFYPDNTLAQQFADLLKKKTLTRDDCKRMADMGLRVVIRGDETEVME